MEKKMASCTDLIQELQEELICPICREYLTNPLSIECGHSFCQSCLLRSCQEDFPLFNCSECRSVSQLRDFQVNVCLGKLATIAKILRPHSLQNYEGHDTCGLHPEVQKLFCRDDHSPVSVSSSQSQEHQAYIGYCVHEAAEDFRGKLQETVNDLWRTSEKIVQKIANEKVLFKMLEEEMETQKKNILSEFQKAQQFLDEAKNMCLSIVQTQGRANLDGLKKRIGGLSNHCGELRRRITESEEECKKPDVDFLQNVTGILKKNESVLCEKIESFLIKRIVCPIPGIIGAISKFKVDVTLDRNTAGPGLIISEDLKSVSYRGIEEDVPINSERLGRLVSVVLGTQSFISKRCYWEVKVPDNSNWCLGVCKISPEVEDYFALMALSENNCCYLYAIAENHHYQTIKVRYHQINELNLKVGIFLDYERGEISFYNVRERHLIYSFPTASFSGPLKPLFSLSKKVLMNDCPLTICP